MCSTWFTIGAICLPALLELAPTCLLDCRRTATTKTQLIPCARATCGCRRAARHDVSERTLQRVGGSPRCL
jgi:hypothetical protein